MEMFQGKTFGFDRIFDPAEGILVRSPLANEPGWWAGAPSASFDPVSNQFFLVYRLRQPRGQGRGVECRIAASDNGVTFVDIWALPKSTLGAQSLDRASLVHCADGMWRLYIGHVDESDGRWRISYLEAREPDQFQIGSLQPLLSAQDVLSEGVKDPNVFRVGPMYYLLASYARVDPERGPALEADRHAGGDVYSTGLIRSRSGAAVSGDGKFFQWIGDVSPNYHCQAREPADPGLGWDSYCRRLTSILPMDGGGYLAFYDGGRTVDDNYEERTGLAMTFDLRTYYSLSPTAPVLVSPHGSGSLRYVDVLPVGNELFYYYEIACADGSHELRVNVVDRH